MQNQPLKVLNQMESNESKFGILSYYLKTNDWKVILTIVVRENILI